MAYMDRLLHIGLPEKVAPTRGLMGLFSLSILYRLSLSGSLKPLLFSPPFLFPPDLLRTFCFLFLLFLPSFLLPSLIPYIQH